MSHIDYEKIFRDFLRDSILKDVESLEFIINNKYLCFALYKENQCKYANKSIANIFALSLQDFIKFRLEEYQRFIHNEDFQKVKQSFKEFTQTKQDKSIIIRIITANGIEKIINLMFLSVNFNKESFYWC